MKKLVFLHGSGADKKAYHDLMCRLARLYNADLVSFNAPFDRTDKPGKFTWFNKVEENLQRVAVTKEYMYSLKYIKEQLKNLQTPLKDIILLGHSQGGGMAVHVGLEMELAGVISINGDLPYNIAYNRITDTPIYWFESKKDAYITVRRKESYQLIPNNKNFHFLTLENSTHNNFQDDFLNIVQKGAIKF